MFGQRDQTPRRPEIVSFFLVPDFSMMAFTAAVEPLRAANRLAERALYRWRTVSADGAPVTASNGVSIQPDLAMSEVADGAAVFLASGLHVERFRDPGLCGWLHRLTRRGVPLGGICTGAHILARAGLLGGYRCTIHWENVEGFVEEFPSLELTATLFEVDRDRYTCSGGTAPLDMMLDSIHRDHGAELALGVAEQMLHTIIRHPHDPQRLSLQHRTGISHPKLLAVIARMEAYLESPLPLAELAAAVAVSPRQLERLFRRYLQTTPRRYYLELRLQRARLLLVQTTMPVLQVAVACGFSAASHFARSYRMVFGRTPRGEREQAAAACSRTIGRSGGADRLQ